MTRHTLSLLTLAALVACTTSTSDDKEGEDDDTQEDTDITSETPTPTPTPDATPTSSPTPMPTPTAEPLPTFLNQAVRVEWEFFTTNSSGGTQPEYTLSRALVFALDGLRADPGPLEELYLNRRTLGSDCIVDVMDEPFDVSGRTYPPALIPASDVGLIRATFNDTNGVQYLRADVDYDSATMTYPGFSDFTGFDPGQYRVADEVAFLIDGNLTTFDSDPAPNIRNLTGNTWDAAGMSISFTVNNAPAGYLMISFEGTDHVAVLTCAKAASSSQVSLNVPDLRPLFLEIGWDGSQYPLGGHAVGTTSLADPRHVGPLGLLQQAIDGPELVLDRRTSYNLF